MRSVEKKLLAAEAANAPESLSAERFALALEVLRGTGRLRLQVRGASMLPTLWPHDEVEIAACSAGDLRPGEIVLAQRNGRFFLHRFIARCEAGGFLLQGDSMSAPDPQFPDDALLGRLSGCSGQRCVWDSLLALTPGSRAIGRVLCYCGFARRIALRLHAMRHPTRSGGYEPYDIHRSNAGPLSRAAGPGAA